MMLSSLISRYYVIFLGIFLQIQRYYIFGLSGFDNYNEIDKLRTEIDIQIQKGEIEVALERLSSLEHKYKTLKLGNSFPSFYNLKGVALFESNRAEEALQAFTQAIQYYPEDLRALINLASILPQFGEESADLYHAIERLTGARNVEFSLKNIDWKGVEEASHQQQVNLATCVERKEEGACDLSTTGISFMLLAPPVLTKYIVTKNNFSNLLYPSSSTFPSNITSSSSASQRHRQKIKIGFLLTRIDSGPVMDLSHIFFKYLHVFHSERVESIAFFINQHSIQSNYQKDIMNYFHQTISLVKLNLNESVNRIRQENIDILIEMNGWNTNTGLLIMKERPAKILISYLGDPVTTGTYFIDYLVADKVSTPPEGIQQGVLTERLALLPTSYLVNSYLEWQKNNKLLQPIIHEKKVVSYPRMSKLEFIQSLNQLSLLPLSHKTEKTKIKEEWMKSTFFLGCFHNWNKISPFIFHVWMNIIRTIPNSQLIMMKGRNITNLALEAQSHGIPFNTRFHLLPHFDSHEEHYYYKSAIDLYLDTVFRNGHVTSLDAQFVGIPSLAVSGLPSRMSARSSESIQYHSTSPKRLHHDSFGIVFSVKEYEDLAIRLGKSKEGRRVLYLWRKKNIHSLKNNRLFNTNYFTKEFIYLMQSLLEVKEKEASRKHQSESRKYHAFAST